MSKNNVALYKHTEIGTIPEDWEVKELIEVAEIISGGTPNTSISDFWNGNILWCTPTDITFNNSKYINSTKRQITENGLNNCSASLLPIGTILFCSRATIGEMSIANKQISTNQGFKSMIVKNNCYNEYLYYQLKKIKNRFIERAIGSTFLEISKKDISKIQIPLPPLAEQKAIATALSDMDALLDNLKLLITKKKDIKKGTMQQLLTGKKRLAGFTENWEVKKLGELVDFFKGNGLSKSKLSENGDFKCLLYGELFTKYNEVINEVISKTNFKEGTLSKNGDILMPSSTTTNGVDLAIALSLNLSNILLGGDINVLRPKIKLHSEFLSRYLTNVKKNEIVKETQGITIIHLYGKKLKDMIVKIPTLKEQTAIAEILSDMDAEIEALENQLAKYQNLKQGMMQELLTGKTRFSITN